MSKNPNWRLTSYKKFDYKKSHQKHAEEVLNLVYLWKETENEEILEEILRHPRVFKPIEKLTIYYYKLYKDLGLEKEDLRQEGMLGFYEGLRKYKLPENQIIKEGRTYTSPTVYCFYWVRRNMHLLVTKLVDRRQNLPTVTLEEEIVAEEAEVTKEHLLDFVMPFLNILEFQYLCLKLSAYSKASDIEVCRGLNISNKLVIPKLKKSIKRKVGKYVKELFRNGDF